VAGSCRTIRAAAGDNLAIHHALDRLQPNEILCVAAPGAPSFGVWGEITTTYALQQGAAGLVTSCGVRDIAAIEAIGFPVFAAAHAIQGTVKRDSGEHEVPVRIGQALIRQGDWIVCDADGCVVIAAEQVEELALAAESKAHVEAEVMDAIRAGASTRRALALD
jgi:4-hydroxy-4-methyl-2-oxoglutarate aldolase